MRLDTIQSAGKATHPDVLALGPWFHNLHLPDGRQTARTTRSATSLPARGVG